MSEQKTIPEVKALLEKHRKNHKEYCRGVVHGLYIANLVTPNNACQINHWIETEED